MIYVTHDQIEALTLADRIAVMKGGVIQQLDEPHTIYNRPRNLFVAGFLGSPAMSFLNGAVEAKGTGFSFRIGDHDVPLAGYIPDGEVRAANDAILGVRPEHVEIFHDKDAPKGLTYPGVVDLEEPMGADSLVWISFGGQTVSARVDSSKRFRPGDNVRLSFNLPMASLFDQQTENRM
jgi:multiple sugar transport system ATP-binding protein